jgi:hypothetical protein
MFFSGLKVMCEIREMTGMEKKLWRTRLEFDAGGNGSFASTTVAGKKRRRNRPPAPHL